MPYLNLDPNFSSHPKAMRLSGRLGANTHLLMINLWCFAAKFHPRDGDLSIYSIDEIESFAAWAGDKHCFYNACVEVGFIDVKKDGKSITLHDWKNHQGHLEALKLRAQKAAKARWNKIQKARANTQPNKPQEDECNATSNAKKQQAMLDECSFPSSPSSPSIPSSPSEIKSKSHCEDATDVPSQSDQKPEYDPKEELRRENLKKIVDKISQWQCMHRHKNPYAIAQKILDLFDGDTPFCLLFLDRKKDSLKLANDASHLLGSLTNMKYQDSHWRDIESDAHKQI